MRLALGREVGGIEIDLGPLNAGAGYAQPANPIVETVGDQHRAGAAEQVHPAGAVDFGRIRRADVAVEARRSDPGHGGDGLGGQVDAPHPIVQVVGDVHAAAVDGRAPGPIEVRLRQRTVGERRGAVTGHRVDQVGGRGAGAHGVDPPDPVIEAIGDVQVRGRSRIQRHPVREVQVG